MNSLLQSLVSWIALPAVLLAISFGLGALIGQLTRLVLPGALMVPVGGALAIVLAFTGYVAGLHGIATPALIAVVAAAGVALWIRRERRLPRPGLGAVVWTTAYVLYIAPDLLSGHWTWLGYNFVNDTSVQLLLADWITQHSRDDLPRMYVSTPLDVIHTYLATGYPLGSHALLGAMHELLRTRLEILYQPFISTFAAIGAMALAQLTRRLVGPRWAATVALTAVASNLLYQYALQGNMKEIVTASMIATTAAAAAWSLQAVRSAAATRRGGVLVGTAVVVALPVGATVDVLSTAGGPYAALIVALWVVLLFAYRLIPGPRAFGTALAAGIAAIVLTTVLTLSKLITFGKVTATVYAGSPATQNDLGQLLAPLQVRQTAGVWLVGDYRVAPTGADATLTTVGIWIVLALAVVGVLWLLRRRRLGVLLFSVPVVAIMLVVTPRTSPYADAKTYMLMAPGVTLLGALGAAALARARRGLGVVLAGIVLVGVLASDALAYHVVQLAPTDRMAALRDLDHRFAGEGPILFNEPEQFAKNFLGDTRLNVGAEALTPVQTQLRVPQAFAYLWFDLDDETLPYVERFPLIVVRRSPVNSRPPSNFHRVYENAYYEVWRRSSRPRVLEHLPLQAVHHPALRPRCADVMALARRAKDSEMLLAAPAPDLVQLDTAKADRSPAWTTHPYRPDMVVTGTPGEAHARVTVTHAGRYRAWIAGSFGREITGWIDGRRIGGAVGVNTVGQWHSIGTVAVAPGQHELRLTRPGGGLSPGDGFAGELGPLALERIAPRPLVRVAPRDARRRLCGHAWDWVERVAR